MAGQITVNTAALKTKAQELKRLNAEFKKQVGNLKTTESALNGMWEGEAKEAFHKAFQSDTVQMDSFYGAIEKYITVLSAIIERYQNAERKNLGTAGSRTYK